jgi:hypothetical protein
MLAAPEPDGLHFHAINPKVYPQQYSTSVYMQNAAIQGTTFGRK